MRCLIVEDDPQLRQFLVDCIEDMGHVTAACGTAGDAMRVLKTRKFELLLADYNLPDGTSLPVMDYFGVTCPHSHAILLTGSGVYPNGETALFAPSVDWTLRKPVELQDLRAIIEYAEMNTKRSEAVSGAS